MLVSRNGKIAVKPIVSFDTSGINALYRDGGTAAPLFAGLAAAYTVRLNGTVIDEIIAHRDNRGREGLRGLCRRFLQSDSDILLPFHEITKKLAEAFLRDGTLDFSRLDVRSTEYEEFIRQGDVSEYEDLFAEQRESARHVSKQFDGVFDPVRAGFQRNFETMDTRRPESASELEAIYKRSGGHYWKVAINLFERATGKRVDEKTIRRFIMECPPFRALLSALNVALFHRCVPEEQRSNVAGRNDLFMSVYLPYCDDFVSNDRAQQKALREVVSLADVPTRIWWYEEFARSFSIGSQRG